MRAELFTGRVGISGKSVFVTRRELKPFFAFQLQNLFHVNKALVFGTAKGFSRFQLPGIDRCRGMASTGASNSSTSIYNAPNKPNAEPELTQGRAAQTLISGLVNEPELTEIKRHQAAT